MATNEQETKQKEPQSPRIEKMELYTPSSNTPKRKQKLLVHYSYSTRINPTFRQLFLDSDEPISNLDCTKNDQNAGSAKNGQTKSKS